MAGRLEKCSRCGKLVSARQRKPQPLGMPHVHPGSGQLCGWCVAALAEQGTYLLEVIGEHDKHTVEDIAEFTGWPAEEVVQVLTALPDLDPRRPDNPPCARCRKEPAQDDSKFCIECRLELNKALGQATDALAERVEAMYGRQPRTSASNVRSMLDAFAEKRRRTGGGGTDYATKGRYT